MAKGNKSETCIYSDLIPISEARDKTFMIFFYYYLLSFHKFVYFYIYLRQGVPF